MAEEQRAQRNPEFAEVVTLRLLAAPARRAGAGEVIRSVEASRAR
jgi:hypothetical protein